MRKAMWKWIATILFTMKCCSFSSPEREINIFWMTVQTFWETGQKINIFTKQMWASNAKDEFNANMFTEWRPGILRILKTHGMNTENIQQDGGEETQIYLSDDGRNFEDKTPWNVLPNTIYSWNKNVLHLWIFQKAEIALAEAARENFSLLKNSLTQIDSKLNSKPCDYLHTMPCNM